MLISERLTGGSVDALCEQALERCLKLLPASRGMVLLMGGNGQLFGACRKAKAGRSQDFDASGILAYEATRSRRTIVVPYTKDDERTAALFRAGVRSAVAIPLHHSGDKLGLIYLDSREALPESADQHGASLCDLLAGQLSAEIQLRRALAAIDSFQQR